MPATQAVQLEDRSTVRSGLHLAGPAPREIQDVGRRNVRGPSLVQESHQGLAAFDTRIASRLVEAFGEVRALPNKAVLCVSDGLVLANSVAETELTEDECGLLCALARATIACGDAMSTMRGVDPALPRVIQVHVLTIDGERVGARIEVDLLGSCDDERELHPDARLARTRGSTACERASATASAGLEAAGRVLLGGARGVGKRRLGEELLGPDRIEVDLASEEAAAPGAGVCMLERAARERPSGILLSHLQSVHPTDREALAAVLRRIERSTRIVATVGSDDSIAYDLFGPAVRVPDLQERRDEIPALVDAITREVAAHEVYWLPAALRVLQSAQWESNVRTLRAVVAQVTRDGTSHIGVGNLPAWLRRPAQHRTMSALERSEASIIREALEAAGWNKLRAAEHLGIARSTLYRRMRALKI